MGARPGGHPSPFLGANCRPRRCRCRPPAPAWRRRSALPVILGRIIVEIFTVLDQRGQQQAQATVVPCRLASAAMEATLLLRQPRRGLNLPRIITAVMHWLAAVCGLRPIHGHMPSSEAGAGLLITGRLDPVNLLQAVLPAGWETCNNGDEVGDGSYPDLHAGRFILVSINNRLFKSPARKGGAFY